MRHPALLLAAVPLAATLLAVRGRAAQDADPLAAADSVRARMLEELKRRFPYEGPSAGAPAGEAAPEAPAPKADDQVEFRWELPREKAYASLRMTRSTLERYGALHERWEAESRAMGRERLSERYLGRFGGSDALAFADVVFTAMTANGENAAPPAAQEIAAFMMEALKALDTIQSGSALDVLGFETDRYFSDRLGLHPTAAGPGVAGLRLPRLRLRVTGLEKALRGEAGLTRAGATVSQVVGSGRNAWRVDGGVDARIRDGSAPRVVVGASIPWPSR